MWLRIALAFAALLLDPAHSNSGLTRTSFSNELRTGFARLFQNGVEQPIQSPFVLLSPADIQTTDQLFQRPPPFSPLAATGYPGSRPRYELQPQSRTVPYFYVPPRYPYPRGGKRQNDVLVVVVKVSNCTASGNGTKPANGDGGGDGGGGGDDDDDDDDEKAPNPDDDVEQVEIVAGGVEKGKEPSRCVWAILSCCAPSNTPIRYTCFDVLGCSTAFWDTNPCVPAILKAALDQATQFYGPTTSTNRTETPSTPAPTTPPPPPPASPEPAGSDRVALDLRTGVTSATALPAADATQATAA